MMEEWREPWGLTHGSSSCGSLPCSELLSVWAHIYVPTQVHPGDPQSSAGATWALGDVAVAAQEKAAPSWLPGRRHRVVMVWPHIVCSMPAAGFKSKHCLAVMTKKKCSHYSAHIQWQLWVQRCSLGLELLPLIVLAPFRTKPDDPMPTGRAFCLVPGLCGGMCRALEQHHAAGNGVLIHSKWFEATVTCSKSHFAADLRLSCSLSRAHLYNFFFIMLQGPLSFRDGRFLIRQIVPLEMKLS